MKGYSITILTKSFSEYEVIGADYTFFLINLKEMNR